MCVYVCTVLCIVFGCTKLCGDISDTTCSVTCCDRTRKWVTKENGSTGPTVAGGRITPNRRTFAIFPPSHHHRQHSDGDRITRSRMAPFNLSSSKSRNFHARAILGPKLHDRLPNINVLIVGAGGIGCELRRRVPSRWMLSLTTDDWHLQSRTSYWLDSGTLPCSISTLSISPT